VSETVFAIMRDYRHPGWNAWIPSSWIPVFTGSCSAFPILLLSMMVAPAGREK
jgi:hypothetical protein